MKDPQVKNLPAVPYTSRQLEIEEGKLMISDKVPMMLLRLLNEYTSDEEANKLRGRINTAWLTFLPLALARALFIFVSPLLKLFTIIYLFAQILYFGMKAWLKNTWHKNGKHGSEFNELNAQLAYQRVCKLRPRFSKYCRENYPWVLKAEYAETVTGPQDEALVFAKEFNLDTNAIVTPIELAELCHVAIVAQCRAQRAVRDYKALSAAAEAKAKNMCEKLLDTDLGFKGASYARWYDKSQWRDHRAAHLHIFFLRADDKPMPWIRAEVEELASNVSVPATLPAQPVVETASAPTEPTKGPVEVVTTTS